MLALALLCPACDAGETSGDANARGRAGSGGGEPAGSGGAGGTGAGGSNAGSGGGGPVAFAPNGYYVQGSTIHRHDGTPHRFLGLCRPSLEWSESGENLYASDYELMAGWGANVVRIALNQAFWLRNPGYATTVDQQIDWAQGQGMDVILDLHWSDRGSSTGQAEQQRMADRNSKTFWGEVAARYADDGRVLFELYNEPHDVSWDVWRNGGASGDGFTVVGMQELYDTVRGAGADNLVLIGGLDYAYDLKGIRTHRIDGYNIVYVTHPYDYPNKQPSRWATDWGYLAATDAVMVTEFGAISGTCDTSYYQALVDYAADLGVSWTAWAWYVKDCGFPSLIVNWNGDPSPPGAVVRSALLGM